MKENNEASAQCEKNQYFSNILDNFTKRLNISFVFFSLNVVFEIKSQYSLYSSNLIKLLITIIRRITFTNLLESNNLFLILLLLNFFTVGCRTIFSSFIVPLLENVIAEEIANATIFRKKSMENEMQMDRRLIIRF